MNFKSVIYCISLISINDIITNNLLFDIFRIYQDYLDVSKELSIIYNNSNINKLICEEIKYYYRKIKFN